MPSEEEVPPSISIGVPTYNQAEFLRETLTSLLNQDVPPLELVVSDNHSTDNTGLILREFGTQIRVISPPRHLEVHEHFNYLAERLRGEWFSLLSSDDVAEPNYVRTLAKGTTRSPAAVIVRGGWKCIDEAGRTLSMNRLPGVRRCVRPPGTLLENVYGSKTSLAAFAVRKRAWEAVGGFPTECVLYGDWVFWLRLAPLGDFILEPRIISGYRTDYRPGLWEARYIAGIPDEELVSTRIIPEAARAIGGVDGRVIQRGMKRRFLALLPIYCELVPPAERDEVAAAMQKWAEAADCVQELDGFRRGEQVARRSGRLRAFARPIANALWWPRWA